MIIGVLLLSLVVLLPYLITSAPVPQDNTITHKSVIDEIIEINEKGNINGINDELEEGDILPPPGRERYHFITKRAAHPNTSYIWEDGIMNYEIDSAANPVFTASEVARIEEAMNLISESTCIQFKEYNGASPAPENRVKIIRGSGCYSYVGRIRGLTTQHLSLAEGCFPLGTVAHELMHALGFYHEQSRPDRDCHVTINYENIQNGSEINFKLQTNAIITGPYDIGSVMHYSRKAFSKNGLDTIVPRDITTINLMGQRHGLAQSDFDGINFLYGCTEAQVTVPPCSQTNIVNGGWSDWVSTGSCSASCGGGQIKQVRLCNNPRPQYGGLQCQGDTEKYIDCNNQLCPIDGEWSGWSVFLPCDKTCGGGLETQTRTCTNPSPQYNGAFCSGLSTRFLTCNTSPCPVVINGQWTSWVSSGACSVSCGGGTLTETRSCTNPSPENGGAYCTGLSYQTQSCNIVGCPVDGGWSSWTNVGSCSATCGNGQQEQVRSCDNPIPQNGGAYCSSPSSKTVPCELGPCSTGTFISCDFSSDMCDWTSVTVSGTDNVLTWKRLKDSTPSLNTGPTTDHSGDGYYAYVETSEPARDGQYAVLESQTLPGLGANGKRCLSYWIHRYGEGIGVTNVMLEQNDTKSLLHHHPPNERKNDWVKWEMQFDSQIESKILFESYRGSSWDSDVAIDDVIITSNECAATIECDFESDTCEWTIDNDGLYELKRYFGRTPSDGTGPDNSESFYLYAEASYPAEHGQKSTLTSPMLDSSVQIRCLRFDTYMHGAAVEALRVFTYKNGKRVKDPSLVLVGHKGPKWISEERTINGKIEKIIFEFERGVGWNSDIAIDNVKITNGSC